MQKPKTLQGSEGDHYAEMGKLYIKTEKPVLQAS